MRDTTPTTMTAFPPRPILALRGRALSRAISRLLALRSMRAACFRCDRLLAAGAPCPEHGYTNPPVIERERMSMKREPLRLEAP